MKLDHAAIRVTDLSRAQAWYCEVMGMVETAREDGTVHLGCGGRTDLTLLPGGAGLDHFAYAVDDRDELAALAGRLRAAGLAPGDTWHDTEPGVGAGFEVCLPSGHRLQLVVADPPPAYMHPAERLPAAVHGPLGIDHVNLSAQDPATLADCLSRQLGFKLSDVVKKEPDRVVGVWLRHGERHHDLAAVGHERDALHHIAYTVSSAGVMIAFADRLVSYGGRAEYGIGRHGPGANLFLYFRDPAGNRVELTAEMAPVPDTAAPGVWWRGDPRIGSVWTENLAPSSFWQVT